MDGILNINKPAGRTSFSIVAMIRRLSGERRAGHAGTLDPAATGVLPVCLGRGTRIVEFLIDISKTYVAEIELGKATDTYDASGQITRVGDYTNVSRERMESNLQDFMGNIQQTPPMYSAIKHQGRPLYKLAREGKEIKRNSRPVTIFRLDLMKWQPPVVKIEVECSKGTYIRSLAYDLGEKLGCGAHLKSLVRTKVGEFDIKDAVPVPKLEDAFTHGYWEQFLYPIDSVLKHIRAIVVNQETEDMIKKGMTVVLEKNGNPGENGTESQQQCRAYTLDGRFLGILNKKKEDAWKPKKIFI